MKIYVIKIEEYSLTGIAGKTLIAGVHKKKPTKRTLKEYAKEWETDINNFEISEHNLQN